MILSGKIIMLLTTPQKILVCFMLNLVTNRQKYRKDFLQWV